MARRGKKKRQKGQKGEQPVSPAAEGAKVPEVRTKLASLLKAALTEGEADRKRKAEVGRAQAGQLDPGVGRGGSGKPMERPVSHARPGVPAASAPDGEHLSWNAGEMRMLNDAYEGVVPLANVPRRTMQRAASRASSARTRMARQDPFSAEEQARARLNALVGEGVRFLVRADEDGATEALRDGVPRRDLKRLRSAAFHPEATLDLHGERVAQVDALVTRFVRKHHRSGCRYLLIVHGKGLHSEDRVGVLGEAVLHSLTRGGAAPLVRALCHAHPTRGGLGALAIGLM